jgi:hypothetical protein
MKTTESMNFLFGGVGKGDSDCHGDCDGKSDNGDDTFNNQ